MEVAYYQVLDSWTKGTIFLEDIAWYERWNERPMNIHESITILGEMFNEKVSESKVHSQKHQRQEFTQSTLPMSSNTCQWVSKKQKEIHAAPSSLSG